MGCLSSKPAGGGLQDGSGRSLVGSGGRLNGSSTGSKGQSRRSNASSGPLSRSKRSQGEESGRMKTADVLGLLDMEIVIKDPLRLGLASDFAEQAQEPNPPREFSLEELEAMTGGFDDEHAIGEGGFGRVYHGRIPREDGSGEYLDVAIKKLNQEGMQGFNEWLTEVIFLRRLRHPHLVGFVGYCTEEEHGVLVYEFMANGSLDYHLFTELKGPTLSWDQRVNVALGAAKGLAYLHEGTGHPVIFRDLKAANILLDENFNAKLSDFGLARDGPQGDRTHVSTKVVGTYGYTAPEYMQTGHLTAKSDVYAFGVVLLELLSGRRAVDESRPWEERNLAFWAKPFLSDKKKLPGLMDPRLGSDFPPKAAQKLAVAASCCLLDVKSRPSMVHLVQILQGIKEIGDAYKKQQQAAQEAAGGSERKDEGPNGPQADASNSTPEAERKSTDQAIETKSTAEDR